MGPVTGILPGSALPFDVVRPEAVDLNGINPHFPQPASNRSGSQSKSGSKICNDMDSDADTDPDNAVQAALTAHPIKPSGRKGGYLFHMEMPDGESFRIGISQTGRKQQNL